jgi:hypothetical protein
LNVLASSWITCLVRLGSIGILWIQRRRGSKPNVTTVRSLECRDKVAARLDNPDPNNREVKKKFRVAGTERPEPLQSWGLVFLSQVVAFHVCPESLGHFRGRNLLALATTENSGEVSVQFDSVSSE